MKASATAPVRRATKPIPTSITATATSFPAVVCGLRSPYPTGVIVVIRPIEPVPERLAPFYFTERRAARQGGQEGEQRRVAKPLTCEQASHEGSKPKQTDQTKEPQQANWLKRSQ
jgi:hypothetical protein